MIVGGFVGGKSGRIDRKYIRSTCNKNRLIKLIRSLLPLFFFFKYDTDVDKFISRQLKKLLMHMDERSRNE